MTLNIRDAIIEHEILNVPSFIKDASGNVTGLATASGVPIVVTDVVADWAELQAIPKTAGNDNIVMHVDGLGVAGSDWRYKHDYSRWFAVVEPILKESFTPVTHGATLTTEEVGFEYRLLNDYGGANKSILQDGDFLIVGALFTKTGTADAMRPNLRFGTAAGVAGTSVWAPTPGATNISVGIELVLQRVSATKLRLISQINNAIAGLSFSNTTAWQGDVTVSNMDTSSTFYLDFTFKCSTSTGDTAFKIENHTIRLRAGREG